jgi:hypothetical protein
VGAAPGGNERRRRKNKTKTLKTKSLLYLKYITNYDPENPNFWGFFLIAIEGFTDYPAITFLPIIGLIRYNFLSITL